MIANLLIALLILGVIYAIIFYLLPEPAKRVGVIIVAILAIIVLVNFVLQVLGHGPIVPIHLT